MERAIDVQDSSRILIDILRSTLSLVGYYGDVSGHDAMLYQLKSSLVQTIADLEEVSENEGFDPLSSDLKSRSPSREINDSPPLSKRA